MDDDGNGFTVRIPRGRSQAKILSEVYFDAMPSEFSRVRQWVMGRTDGTMPDYSWSYGNNGDVLIHVHKGEKKRPKPSLSSSFGVDGETLPPSIRD